MKKELRIKVWNKYGNRCAYCGEKIEYKNMQVDHIIPALHTYTVEDIMKFRRIKGNDDFNNLNPSCRICNKWKNDSAIEFFRSELSMQLERANKTSANYRMAELYGQVVETPNPIVFYFEKSEKK